MSMVDLPHILPDYCHGYIRPALAGDAAAARLLVASAPNNLRLHVVCALVDTPVLAVALRSVWAHDWFHLRRGLSGDRLEYLFRRAGLVDAELPRVVTVYRGGRGTFVQLRRGWSWTLSYEMAHWYAPTFRGNDHRPGDRLVLTARIRSSRILAVIHERDEQEIVIRGARHARLVGPQ